MASLCISPVQAGIMLFSTANSSFILDRRRRSIRLWAVFLAAFLPAALVGPELCFRLLPEELVDVVAVEPLGPATGVTGRVSSRGFIWMILRERVGGGGNSKASFNVLAAEELFRRGLAMSLSLVEPGKAGGGNSKASSMEPMLGPS